MARENIIEAVKGALKLQEAKYVWQKMITGKYVLSDSDGVPIVFRSKTKAGSAAFDAGARKGSYARDTGYTKKGKPFAGWVFFVKEPPNGS